MDQVSFDVSNEERATISKIADRALDIARQAGSYRDVPGRTHAAKRVHVEMDMIACHANGCPLRLDDLLAADDFNFSHDVFRIIRHLDRETGELTDFFRPRFARPAPAAAA